MLYIMSLDKNFEDFMLGIDNYKLYDMIDMVEHVASMFYYTEKCEYAKALDEYNKFVGIITREELYGTTDLCDPVHKIYYNHIKPYI